MSIAPVRAQTEVSQPPAKAFELFTTRMGEWWQEGTPGANPAVAITLEPFPGGRWFEVDAAGVETRWGKVIEWQPPARLLLIWEMNSRFQHDPGVVTEIEITFSETASGGTRVDLEHRKLEAYGADAERLAESINKGWPKQLAGFVRFAETEQQQETPR
jgi:uncharacterized protein YndB with AHSA1/START domain